MTGSKRIKTLLSLAAVAMATLCLMTDSAQAQLQSQLGILDLNANGGINPTTGAPWAHGDTYRLMFASSQPTTATSTDIADYNNFIQGLANASNLGGAGNLASVNWNAVGSTLAVDQRDNNNTNPGVDGTGEAIFLMNGTSVFAINYTDLYDFKPNANTGVVDITLSETGGAPFDGGDFTSIWTGSNIDGTVDANNPLGDNDGTVRGGLYNWDNGRQWLNRFTLDPTTDRGILGLSEPLTVIDPDQLVVPEPASITIWSLIGIGLAGFGYYRIRGNK